MSVYKRHFRVTTGALADEAKRIQDLTEQVRLAWIPLLTRLGAENYRYWADGTFAGFGFKSTPDQKLYRVDRKHRDIWLPRKTTAEGKALPPAPYGATATPTAKDLITPPTQARPTRDEELLKESKKRTPDPFDLPPQS